MKDGKILIGLLAMQGCVTPHKPHLEALGVAWREIKCKEDMQDVDGYILPGGESSAMLRLLAAFDLEEALKAELAKKPAWGICAGSILMAKKVTNPEQRSFGLINMTVQRNGYGAQLDSHETEYKGYPVAFIRAPIMSKVGNDVEVVFEWKGQPAYVRQGNYMATTFHPELTEQFPSPLHTDFVNMVKKVINSQAKEKNV